MTGPDLDELEQRWKQTHAEPDAEAYLDALRRRVDESPTARARLRLGRAYYDTGQVDCAIPELQQAKQSAACRGEAGYWLARSFVSKRIYKMAAREFRAAREALGEGAPLAKEITYMLGRLYEAAGQTERAIREYVRITGDWPPPDGGAAGVTAPLRPTDPPRVPPPPHAGEAPPPD